MRDFLDFFLQVKFNLRFSQHWCCSSSGRSQISFRLLNIMLRPSYSTAKCCKTESLGFIAYFASSEHTQTQLTIVLTYTYSSVCRFDSLYRVFLLYLQFSPFEPFSAILVSIHTRAHLYTYT